MRIPKSVFAILATAVIILLAGLPVVQAGEGLEIWPTEPDVRGAVKTKATFSAYEYPSAEENMVEAVLILRVRTGNSWTWNFFTTYTANPYHYTDDGARQSELMQFLNRPDVVSAICPSCDASYYVHIKRAYDDGLVVVYPYPKAIVADFELVVNQEPW